MCELCVGARLSIIYKMMYGTSCCALTPRTCINTHTHTHIYIHTRAQRSFYVDTSGLAITINKEIDGGVLTRGFSGVSACVGVVYECVCMCMCMCMWVCVGVGVCMSVCVVFAYVCRLARMPPFTSFSPTCASLRSDKAKSEGRSSNT